VVDDRRHEQRIEAEFLGRFDHGLAVALREEPRPGQPVAGDSGNQHRRQHDRHHAKKPTHAPCQ